MTRLRPSLVRRLTIAFVISDAIALLVFIIALWPFARLDGEDQVGADAAISMLRHDLRADAAGLHLPQGSDIETLEKSSPGLWFIVKGEGVELSRGRAPASVRQALSLLSGAIKTMELGHLGASGPEGDASIDQVELSGRKLVIAAGGVRGNAVTFPIWITYLLRDGYLAVVAGAALFTLAGGLVAIPLVVRSIRPTTRAAAGLDWSDLRHRLPERDVVKELVPLVRAFNEALERLAAGFERRKRFIADVAHELRTPESRQKTDLQRTVYRLGQIVGQMLDAERLTFTDRRRERIDLVGLARAAVADIAPLAVANGYELAVSTKRDEIPVLGDSHAIARAIGNLLGNAVAHGGGRGTIAVLLGPGETLDVSDEGPGIPVEARNRIFEPFYRERWDKDGCGLGLHLVREIMHAHGGEVNLVSSSSGATFRLTFAKEG
jgi:signal transduction histidine kinase